MAKEANLNKKLDKTAAEAARPQGTPEPLDLLRLDGQIYSVLKSRIERACKHQQDWWDKGLATRKFIKGDQWAADLAKIFTGENGWIRKSVNKMKALETGLISQIAFQQPKNTALPLGRLPSAIGAANVETALINLAYTECDFDTQQMKIAKDALHFGAGFGQVGTNAEKSGLTQVLWRPAEDVVFDPDAKEVESATWCARRFKMNVHAARKKYNDKSIVSEQESNRLNSKKDDRDKLPQVAPEDETVEIWEVWCRADALEFMDAKEYDARNKAKDNVNDDAPEFLKYLSKNGNRMFHVCLNHPKLLKDSKWPFIIDNNLLPIWPCYLEVDTETILPPSALEAAKGLQRAMNTIFTFLTTQAYVTARIKFVGDKSQLANEEVKNRIDSPIVGDLVGVEGGHLNLQPLNLGNLNTAMTQLFKMTVDQFDTVTGFNEIFGGMQGTRSAAEAVIRDSRAQTNSSMMRATFMAGIKRINRMMLQVAHSTLKADKVALFVGREEMGYINPETGAVDADDRKNTLAVNWDDKMTPEQIRRENRIEIVTNSTQRTNPQQEVSDMRLLVQDLTGLISVYTQQGYRINQTRMARKLNYVFGRLLQALGIADYKQMEVTPEDLSIDDRLMPRGQTEEQMFAKFKQKEDERREMEDADNAGGLAAFLESVQGMSPEEAQTLVAQISPEQRVALVQALQGSEVA